MPFPGPLETVHQARMATLTYGCTECHFYRGKTCAVHRIVEVNEPGAAPAPADIVAGFRNCLHDAYAASVETMKLKDVLRSNDEP